MTRYLKPAFMRFPVLVKNKIKTTQQAKKESAYLEDGWSDAVVIPSKSQLVRKS